MSKPTPFDPDNRLWFISGVSLGIPPWPNVTQSKAILLNPVHVKRLVQEGYDASAAADRKKRVYLNLVVLFRLVVFCQHLAFDRDAFWEFVRSKWNGACNAKQLEYLVGTYSRRRSVYLENKRILRRHRDILTDLIDAWHQRDPEPSASKWPEPDLLKQEWAAVARRWEEQVKLDYRSLVDESNPPTFGFFTSKRDLSSTFRIKGEGTRARESKSLDPCQTHEPVASPTSSKTTEMAVDELVDTRGRSDQKRKADFEPESSEVLTPSKRSRESYSSPNRGPSTNRGKELLPKRLNQAPTSQDDESKIDHEGNSADGGEVTEPDEDDAVTHVSLSPPHAKSDGVEGKEALNPLQTSSASGSPGSILARHSVDQSSFHFLESKVGEQDHKMNALHERTKLLMESGDLSRDIQKAHNELTVLTASSCQSALEKLDTLTGRLSALAKDVAACRCTAQEIKDLQDERANNYQAQVHEVKQGLVSVVERLDVMERSQQQVGIEEGQAQITSEELIRLDSSLKSIRETLQKTAQDMHDGQKQHEFDLKAHMKQMSESLKAATASIQSLGDEHRDYQQKRQVMETRLTELESKRSGQQKASENSSDVEQRLITMEDVSQSNTTLIDNCRTLVEVTKTNVDQKYGSLENRLALLEQRLKSRTAEQDKIAQQQAARMDRLEAELKRYRTPVTFINAGCEWYQTDTD
ncbi:hypothetical protein C8034_v005590 [Colletotrichum sidae]|uniref:Uncharacterized protein n=1 Tax=Colletotrichum sidae TaxID=1347389 RepID=A0A4R8T6C3_9PEZI|nr:hypothetical protein C8034_v005590 [Colletotrichum sidae]